MKKVLYSLTIIFSILTIATCIAFKLTQSDIFQTLYITFLTFSYHLIMRLIVGAVVNLVYKKRNYNAKWFQPRAFEKKLYKMLKVKKWKEKIPTWSPEGFDTKSHTLSEIAEGMCGAEVVHEVIVVLSFVPVLFSLEFGAPAVFIITSILAAATDTVFVIVQRYNRPRIVKLINR